MNILIIAAAALPCLLLLRFIRRFDRDQPEPRLLILKLFAAGMITPLIAGIIELIILPLFTYLPANIILPVQAFLGIAVPEEAVKMAALLLILRHRKEFDEILDGGVYGVTVAMGFALVENILYVIGAHDPMSTALIRGFTAIPLHALAGGFMGLAIAWDRIESRGSLNLAFLIAVVIHGSYDMVLMDPRFPSSLIALILVFGWGYLIKALRKARKEDREAGRIPPK